MKRRLFLFLSAISLLILTGTVHSQVNTIFTPFVSRIKTESTAGSVKISWKDTGDVKGNCLIYRHTSPVNSDNFDSSVKIARIPQGVEYYEDFPPYTHTNYYYAILMEDEKSLLHEVFIPFRNLTHSAASIKEKTENDSPALVTAIDARAATKSIRLSFRCSKPSAELFVYRNIKPIVDQNDLLTANLIASLSGSASLYTDYPIPGIGYYYGIIDSNLIKTGNYIFKAGENITIIPAEIALVSTERVGLPKILPSRSKPLPYLSISRGFQTGRQLSPSVIDSIPELSEVSPETEEYIKKLLSRIPEVSRQELKPLLLKPDSNAPSGSERSMLLQILEADFLNGNFASAADKLLEFQMIKRSREIEASIHFYLGQIYYFLNDKHKALTEFLFAEEFYYLESRPWIESLFKKLRK
ncbi:MAG: hypothetical protein JEZ04_04805 [Spirochaetales bacterium]|nr:hypothetical protein [Spirochaetales bacterium]